MVMSPGRAPPYVVSSGSKDRLVSLGSSMPHDELDELLALLARARAVLDRYIFEEDGEVVRDDIAEVCMAIDDALPVEGRVQVRKAELDRSLLDAA